MTNQKIELSPNIDGEELTREDCVLRYMNIEKFLYFIENGIYFSRVDTFDDRFEGDYMSILHETSKLVYGINDNGEPDRQALQRNKEAITRNSYALCLALGEQESMAHWDIYGGGKNSVAIKTNIGKLIDELESYFLNIATEESKIIKLFSTKIAAKISYIDYKKSDIVTWHTEGLNRLLSKHYGYIYENEARILYSFYDGRDIHPGTKKLWTLGCEHGLTIPVNLENLLVGVIISPRADAWIHGLVKKVLLSKGFCEDSLKTILQWSEFRHSPSEKSKILD